MLSLHQNDGGGGGGGGGWEWSILDEKKQQQ